MTKKFEIRNSTAEFLTFVAENKEDGVQVFYKDETIWATQAAMGELFGCSSDNIGVHLKNIFNEGELDSDVVVSKMEITTRHGAIEGKTQTNEVDFYNLDAIIAVGYRVSSMKATRFRQWATSVLNSYIRILLSAKSRYAKREPSAVLS